MGAKPDTPANNTCALSRGRILRNNHHVRRPRRRTRAVTTLPRRRPPRTTRSETSLAQFHPRTPDRHVYPTPLGLAERLPVRAAHGSSGPIPHAGTFPRLSRPGAARGPRGHPWFLARTRSGRLAVPTPNVAGLTGRLLDHAPFHPKSRREIAPDLLRVATADRTHASCRSGSRNSLRAREMAVVGRSGLASSTRGARAAATGGHTAPQVAREAGSGR